MSELSEHAKAVLDSLRERPTLNTPTLIAMELDGVDQTEVEEALDELIDAGQVVHRATGWKLAPGAA